MNEIQRQVGQTDIFVSPVALGCWPIAGMTSLDVNDDDSLATIHAALDNGLNFLDTAHCYGANGESEILIGQAIQGRRSSVVIASKGGIHWDQAGVRHFNGHPDRIVLECESSLKRMKIDTIDLYYLHAPDPNIPVGESATAFAKLFSAGKIRAVGVSNLSVEQMDEFQRTCPISAIQPPYNMLQKGIESDIIPWAQQHQCSVINYWPLMKGLLAGKIRRGHKFDPDDKRLTYEIFQGEAFERAQCLLDGLDGIARSNGKTTAQIVINWTIHQPGITATLCGAKRDWQIEETAKAQGWKLPESDLQQIDALLAEVESIIR